MAESLTTKSIEGASGVVFALPFHDDGSDRLYPLVQLVPTELGGCSVSSFVAAASNNATIVKTSAGQVYGYSIFSIDQTPVYLKFYDLATTPSPATDNGSLILRIGVTAVASALGQKREEFFPMGIAFSAGISIAVVTGIADTNNSSVSASEILVNVYYK